MCPFDVPRTRWRVWTDIISAAVLALTPVKVWASATTAWEWIRGVTKPKVTGGSSRVTAGHSGLWLARPGHVAFSHECCCEWGASPGFLPPSLSLFPTSPLSLLPLLFASATVTSMSYSLAPPLLNFYKAPLEVGQIWLNGIKFCSYSTWIKIRPEGC